MGTDWTKNLTPMKYALAAHKGPLTVREAVELRKLKLALRAKGEGR
jgi:hypothetical protein